MDTKAYAEFKTAVRKAWRSRGARATVVDPESGKTLSVMKLTREVSYETGPPVGEKEQHTATENWLVLRPVDRSHHTPVFCIEYEHMGNLRS